MMRVEPFPFLGSYYVLQARIGLGRSKQADARIKAAYKGIYIK